MWFLYVLLILSVLLLPVFLYLRRPQGTRLVARLAGFTDRHAILAVFAAAAPIMLVETAFGPDVNTGGWERLAYLFPLLYGFLIASDPLRSSLPAGTPTRPGRRRRGQLCADHAGGFAERISRQPQQRRRARP
jgi:hypothetical protein